MEQDKLPQEPEILTCKQLADYLQVSVDWVYRNWKDLGGRKIKGIIRFPSREYFYNQLFGKNRNVPSLLSGPRKLERKIEDRHGLLDIGRRTSQQGKKKVENRFNPYRDKSNDDRHNLFRPFIEKGEKKSGSKSSKRISSESRHGLW